MNRDEITRKEKYFLDRNPTFALCLVDRVSKVNPARIPSFWETDVSVSKALLYVISIIILYLYFILLYNTILYIPLYMSRELKPIYHWQYVSSFWWHSICPLHGFYFPSHGTGDTQQDSSQCLSTVQGTLNIDCGSVPVPLFDMCCSEWKPAVDLAAVDCAAEENRKICTGFSITGYPTIKVLLYRIMGVGDENRLITAAADCTDSKLTLTLTVSLFSFSC